MIESDAFSNVFDERPAQVWFCGVELHCNDWANSRLHHPRFNPTATSEQYYSDRCIIWKSWF
jgi:hypothetical protein